jgi:hypothetical protein
MGSYKKFPSDNIAGRKKKQIDLILVSASSGAERREIYPPSSTANAS